MLKDLSEHERTERDAIIADIHASFAGVTLGQRGISWSQCEAQDNYELLGEGDDARRAEAGRRWDELVDDPEWRPFPGIGGFSFINAEGFRYYLPPTMIRFLRGDSSEWYPGHLLGEIERFVDERLTPLWSHPQLRCIARFIAFMARHDDDVLSRPDVPNPWAGAVGRRWHGYLPG